MGQEEAINRVEDPVTVSSLVSDLRGLGVSEGDTLLVHSSMSRIGWTCGGRLGVVEALQEVLGESGTLVMPTHTGQFTDPTRWENPPVPDDWVETIREEMPAFDPGVTPSYGMGVIPEHFRTRPDVVRSDHPEFSFAAWGADAEGVVTDHELDRGLGENSPLARVHDLEGKVLLLGVGHDSNTSLHLAEYRADVPVETLDRSAPVLVDGDRVRVEYEDIEKNTDDFADVGAAFEQEVGVAEGSVGAAESRLIDQRSLVEFAVGWFEANRQ